MVRIFRNLLLPCMLAALAYAEETAPVPVPRPASVALTAPSANPATRGGEEAAAQSFPALKPLAPAEAAERAEKAKLARKFIQALSSDAYPERAAAREKLLALGRGAIEPLEAAARADDSETRLRAMEILIALRGKGFLGIGLQEEDNHVPAGTEDDPERQSDKPCSVLASQVIDFRQGYQQRFGVKRPFPATAAGLESGDRLVEINGRRIRGMKDLMGEIILIGPGRTASIVVERGGKLERLTALLTRSPIDYMQSTNGIEQTVQSGKPPVNMEDDFDFSAEDRKASLKQQDAPVEGEDDPFGE